jgi:lipoate-protein ligase A
VTTVTREIGEVWSGEMLRDVMAFGFAEALGIELAPSIATDAENAIADRLIGNKYTSDDWLAARTPQADATATSLVKTPAGLVRIYIALQGDTIKSALFTGDFNTIPPPIVAFENELKWARLNRRAVEMAAARVFGEGTGLDVEAGVLVDATLAAGERAQRRESVAAPIRDGSCYFPEQEESP